MNASIDEKDLPFSNTQYLKTMPVLDGYNGVDFTEVYRRYDAKIDNRQIDTSKIVNMGGIEYGMV